MLAYIRRVYRNTCEKSLIVARLGFALEYSVNKNGIRDNNRHANQRDYAHHLQSV